MNMRKSGWILILLIIVVAAFYLFIPVTDKAEYKESDLYSYYFYTDKDIKNAPRVSDRYSFSYVSPDGGQGEMSTITFHGGDLAPLEAYLKKMKFSLYRKEDNGRSQIWLSESEKNVVFTLWNDKTSEKISLTKVNG
ncbi:hypothetical protein RBA63_03865 [Brenneria goodwinii]|uniref:hypothetical protein n=1 Tax=Brenneria goodwinii TaxID=1109412 RepID=UPI000BAF049B|nr:hypothetical protein [Brenneria goodwinii]ATA25668.1 hypothetical protein AWC36_16965 [Brenneria goodwinii]MCG8710332.1 hypothetical protein [Brenneria bubanii]